MSGVDKIPTQYEYESALEGNEDLDKTIVKLGELNKVACEDLILSINKSSLILVKNAKVKIFWRETAMWHGTSW